MKIKIDNGEQDVIQSSLDIQWGLSEAPGRASFDVYTEFDGVEGERVEIEDHEGIIWSGTLLSVTKTVDGLKKKFHCECADNYFDFDRRKVPRAWNNTTVKDIVESVVGDFTEGFTTNNVQGDNIDIQTLRSNYEEPSRVLTKLAKEIGWEWYIDENKDVHFFPPGAKPAPVELRDDNQTYFWRSLDLTQDISELKNRVFVRGGELRQDIVEGEAIDKYRADGETQSFPLYYKYTSVQVTVNGVAQTVGVAPIDEQRLEDEEVDCLYRFNPSAIRFKDELSEGDILRVFGEAHIPIISQVEDEDSILSRGVREHLEVRRDVESIEEAELIGEAFIKKFRAGSKDGSFRTHTRGLRPGQKIRIQSDERGIDDTFLITQVTAIDRGWDEDVNSEILEYNCSFLKAGKIKFMDIMERLLQNERRNIDVSPDEKIQRVRSLEDAFSTADETPEITTLSAPYVYGLPADEFGDQRGGNNVAIYGFSTYSQ